MNKLICLECGYVASINYFDYIENDDPTSRKKLSKTMPVQNVEN